MSLKTTIFWLFQTILSNYLHVFDYLTCKYGKDCINICDEKVPEGVEKHEIENLKG